MQDHLWHNPKNVWSLSTSVAQSMLSLKNNIKNYLSQRVKDSFGIAIGDPHDAFGINVPKAMLNGLAFARKLGFQIRCHRLSFLSIEG